MEKYHIILIPGAIKINDVFEGNIVGVALKPDGQNTLIYAKWEIVKHLPETLVGSKPKRLDKARGYNLYSVNKHIQEVLEELIQVKPLIYDSVVDDYQKSINS